MPLGDHAVKGGSLSSCHMAHQIPAFGINGHLPLGRYNVTLEQVEDRFVSDPAFADSRTRLECWLGLQSYIGLWGLIEKKAAAVLADRRLLKTMWLGGSFISAKPNPNNVDLTLFLDGDLLLECSKVGINSQISKLSHRDGMLQRFRVSPTIVRYRFAHSPWDMFNAKRQLGAYEPEHFSYVGLRGCFDDWWCRIRPEGEDKTSPSLETGGWVRGYLEVTL